MTDFVDFLKKVKNSITCFNGGTDYFANVDNVKVRFMFIPKLDGEFNALHHPLHWRIKTVISISGNPEMYFAHFSEIVKLDDMFEEKEERARWVYSILRVYED